MRLLLVEDDSMIADAVCAGLRAQGFTLDRVRDVESARRAHATEQFDLVLLDLGLPKRDGLELLRALRAAGDTVPVLIITARDSLSDRVNGLDAGADDYLVKPFELQELAARARALLRRRAGRAAPKIRHLDVELDPATRTVRKGGVEVPLSPRELSLLELLLERPGAVLSRAQIEQRLYGWDTDVESNAVEVHIHGLRRKLGADFIRNVRGVGYRVATS